MSVVEVAEAVRDRPFPVGGGIEPPPKGRRFPPDALPLVVGLLAFALVFWRSVETLIQDWWTVSSAQSGLLLAPAAVYLAIRKGLSPEPRRDPIPGSILMLIGIGLRILAEGAGEFYLLRISFLIALAGVITFYLGLGQVMKWKVPFVLLLLAVPLPFAVEAVAAWPLQLASARMAAAMLELRGLSTLLVDNVIQVRNHALIVTIGCSGLNSMVSLFALSLVSGSLWLSSLGHRVALSICVLPVALALNGVRIFLTGFLVVFVGPNMGQGELHELLGYVVFVVGLTALIATARALENREIRGEAAR